MRSGQIQHAIAHHGVTPFALCHMVARKIRKSHKRGDHIQDSIGAVFHKLSQPARASKVRSASVPATPDAIAEYPSGMGAAA